MSYKGIVQGKRIELEESLPYIDGQPVRVSIQPLEKDLRVGTPEAIRNAMQAPPRIGREAADEFDRLIEDAKLPVRPGRVFEESE